MFCGPECRIEIVQVPAYNLKNPTIIEMRGERRIAAVNQEHQ